ncbi:hypothetical protein CLI64_10460 [Nostoc sp. CENA543]|uniref:HEAT repeat domain-containing protein n=1 Tax=Nostoc sp. CENA543 TaxID=1869241 RepID=UPI000CA3B439|nr:HEAT repeat domain-containing protein [Nostoc sp. CENA543]AUT00785.1 hypothetical protein CLI64_10460 [Nostoc sp. CENA543]
MLKNTRKYPTAILTTLALIGTTTVINTQAIAQTSLTQPPCTEVESQKYIYQLNRDEIGAYDALVACGSKAVRPLINSLARKNENFRIMITAALGEIALQDSSAVPLLKFNDLLTDQSQGVRVMAANILKKMGKDPVPPLMLALQNPDPQIRQKAADSLGKLSIEAKEAIPSLTNALRDPVNTVRASAAYALGEMGSDAKDAIPFLRNAAQDPDHQVSANADQALKKIQYSSLASIFDRPVPDGLINVGTPELKQTALTHVRNNPPVMCRIPVIKSVLKWKCP